jgi:hypothetical protein
MRGRVQVGFIGILVSFAAVLPAQQSAATSCSAEESKFVEDPRLTYGNKTAMYVYNRPMEACASVANTTFWWLGGNQLDFLEGGTRQFGTGTPSGKFEVFAEYRFYPAAVQYQAPWGPVWDASQTVSLLVSNEVSLSYTLKVQFGFGEVPSSYSTVAVTPYATANYGTPMSEISRYGAANVGMHVTSMKYRDVNGGWPYWDGLRCSLPNSIMDWDGVKTSDHSWDTVYGPVQGGGC